MKRLSVMLLALPLLASSAAAQISGTLRSNLEAASPPPGAEVGLALIDLGSGDTLWIHADWRVHAASTMKVPVLIELAQRVDAGRFGWDWPLMVKNEFHSIVDSSTFALLERDDSEKTLFTREGELVPARELARLMITWSSNFATNLLVDQLGASQIQTTSRRLGADSIVVLRGVEDQKAFDRGLSNTTTARDLAVLLASIAQGQAASDSSTAIMLDILAHQEFREGIPAGVPAGTRIASKTGSITGINHDAAVIYPPSRSPYVLVILTRGFERPVDAEAYMARISAEVWAGLVDGH
jgi:beta-lactamase class A